MSFRENMREMDGVSTTNRHFLLYGKIFSHRAVTGTKLPNITILLSFFGSLYHHFKVQRVDI